MKYLLFIGVVSLAARGVVAQTPTRLGNITVTLRDSTGRGDSLTRGSVCARVRDKIRCASAKHGVRFAIDSVPLGLVAVWASCPSPRGGMFGETVASSVVVRVSDSIPVEQTLDVSYSKCDTRPVRRVTGIMVGHYSSAFEHSGISACVASDWFGPTDSLRRTFAWLRTKQRIKWPKPAHPDYVDENGKKHTATGLSYYFIRARGTLEGPGSYGHMGGSQFQFAIDSVLEVRTPRDNDCR
jgi:hypothetical protein